MGREHRVRPSSLIDIEDPYVAYCFDEACGLWGRYVKAKSEEMGKMIKDHEARARFRAMAVLQIIGEDPGSASESTNGRYADPAKRFGS